jgi:hypothetical protein
MSAIDATAPASFRILMAAVIICPIRQKARTRATVHTNVCSVFEALMTLRAAGACKATKIKGKFCEIVKSIFEVLLSRGHRMT